MICTGKIRDKSNKIIKYILKDYDNSVIQLPANALKRAIMDKKIVVSNLKLTSNGKLIDVAKSEQYYCSILIGDLTNLNKPKKLFFKTVDNLDKIVRKYKLAGYTMNLINDAYIIENNDNVVVISNKNIELKGKSFRHLLYSGSYNFFYSTLFNEIDLRGISKLSNLDRMFEGCKAKRIYLGNPDISESKSMIETFRFTDLDILDLSNLDTRDIESAKDIFNSAKIKELYINNSFCANINHARSEMKLDGIFIIRDSNIQSKKNRYNVEAKLNLRNMYETYIKVKSANNVSGDSELEIIGDILYTSECFDAGLPKDILSKIKVEEVNRNYKISDMESLFKFKNLETEEVRCFKVYDIRDVTDKWRHRLVR